MAPPSDTKDDDLAAALADASSDAPTPATAPAAAGDTDSDAMAAEWEAMLGGGDGDGDDGGAGIGRESTRVLNQDEIDSLLGFDEASDTGSDRAGIQAILNSALVSYERLPMLEVVFDRPFLFAIYHKATKTLLFAGQVAEPEIEKAEKQDGNDGNKRDK